MSHTFISTAVTTMLSLYRDTKDGEIIVENKHINALEINFECVIITFNHGSFGVLTFVADRGRY